MILVEADADAEWDSSTDWAALAESAVKAAVRASNAGQLIGAKIVAEVSVRFTGDAAVQALNAAYRKKDKPTNVLSFPMLDGESILALGEASDGEVLLGDIVLAHGLCAKEAAGKGIAVEAYAAHLVIHGVLHLLGYDHETSDADAEAMEGVERVALATLGLADPYAVTEVQN